MVEIRPITADDARPWLAGAGHLDPAEWRWRLAAPAAVDAPVEGAPRRLGAFADGALLAGAALVPARAFVGGELRTVSELVELHGAAEHARAFTAVASELVDSHLGLEGDLVLHGVLDPASWEVARGPLKFEVVRTRSVLVGSADEGAAAPAGELEVLARFDHQARWLWDRCAGGFQLSTIRDETFLNWRFVDRPGRTYRNLGVRDAEGVLRGYAVVTDGGTLGTGTPGAAALALVDWLVPAEETAVGELLLAGVRAEARARGLAEVRGVLPEWSPWFERFQRRGFRVHPLEGPHVARSRVKRFDMIWLRNGWWTTGADSLAF